jgi:hypothetical protein
MPGFDEPEVIERTVLCRRCEQPGMYRLDVGTGDFSFECPCTEIEIAAIHTGPNVGEIRCCTQPGRMISRIRPSRRTLTTGVHGRLWRELWRCPEGSILQSGHDFVAVMASEDRRQLWFDSFEAAFYQLTNHPWPEGGRDEGEEA